MTQTKPSFFTQIKRRLKRLFGRRYIAINGRIWRYGRDGMFKGKAPLMTIGDTGWEQWCSDNDYLIWLQDGRRCTLRATMQARQLKGGVKVYRYWLGYRFVMGRHPPAVCYIGNIARMTHEEIAAKVSALHERRDKLRDQLEHDRAQRRRAREKARRARYRRRRRETIRRQRRVQGMAPWW